jgi:hypothetical protein
VKASERVESMIEQSEKSILRERMWKARSRPRSR